MRIPGVTVTRGISSSTSTGGTTTTGEATAITVRGFGPSFNTTLFDDRQVPSAVGNTQGNQVGDRAFDFSSVNSDFVSQIDVLKSPNSTLSSGAIGATINVKFPKPFDHPGLVVAGSVSTTESLRARQVHPERRPAVQRYLRPRHDRRSAGRVVLGHADAAKSHQHSGLERFRDRSEQWPDPRFTVRGHSRRRTAAPISSSRTTAFITNSRMSSGCRVAWRCNGARRTPSRSR